MPRIKKSGALRDAYELATQLNDMTAVVDEIRAKQTEAEELYHAMLEAPELLDKVRELAENMPAKPSFQDQIDERMNEIQHLMAKAKRISRKFSRPQTIEGWTFKSHSGGKNKAFNISVLRDLGYGDIEIGGQPLIITEEKVDPKIWDAAVAQGFIKVDTATRAGGFVETNKTRRAAFKKSEES